MKLRIIKIITTLLLLSIIFALFGCDRNKIDAPSNIYVDEENILYWDAVEDAKNYNINFYDVDNDVVITKNTRKLYYNLSELTEGDYEITIVSVNGVNGKKDSNPSDIIYFHKDYETGCVYELINHNLEYALKKVGKANGTFVIEDVYRGKPVTKILDLAFKGSSKVVNVTIGANIESIGESAFYNCNKLEAIVMPDNVSSFGESCFQSCRALSTVVLSKSIEEIPAYAFAYCRSLEEIVIPDTVISIGESAFNSCSALKSFKIPDGVSTIGSSCFSACSSLESIELNSIIDTIPDYCFYNCNSLNTVVFADNNVLKTIGLTAFSGCSSLTEISIPDGVETLSQYAFYDCSELGEIHIPESVTSLGYNVFANTLAFKSQMNDDSVNMIYIDNWVVYIKNSIRESCEAVVTIEEYENLSDEKKEVSVYFKPNTFGIADYVFRNSAELMSAVFPTSMKYIGNYSFMNCAKLWKVRSLDYSLINIGNGAFANCVITNISLGIGLERIGSYAFYGNPQFDNNSYNPTTWIPETVTSIGTDAFVGTKLYESAGDVVYAGNWVVGYKGTGGSVVLEFDSETVAGIADYAFYNMPDLQSVQGVTNCRYIGTGAFAYCTSLASISFGRNLTEISPYAFYGCSSLLNVSLPKALKKIGFGAFVYCERLNGIDLSSTNCEVIDDYAFYGCAGLKEITFNNTLKKIGRRAFYKCIGLKEVTFSRDLTELGLRAFFECTNLRTIVFNDNLTYIPDYCFTNNTYLKEVVIPGNIKSIGRSAFYGCTELEKLVLEEGVEYLTDYSFYGLTDLVEIVIPSTLQHIGNYAFKGASNLEYLYLPETVEEIGIHAFYGCKVLTVYTDAESIQRLWDEKFNTSFRPIFYGVTFNEDGSVKTVIVSSDKLVNKNVLGGISAPNIDGKEFVYFVDKDGNTYTLEDIVNITEETVLTAVYQNVE